MPVPVSAQQSAAVAIAFCTATYRDLPTQQACIASLVPNVGGFISPFGGARLLGTVRPPKPAPRPPGRYCTMPDGSQVWVVDAGRAPAGADC